MQRYLSIISAIVLAMSLSSCYNDQGGNNYDTLMPEMRIQIPQSAYSGGIGQKITIEPVVQTEIPETDLKYIWEVKGNVRNQFGYQTFRPLLPDDLQSRNLSYTCQLDSNLTSLNTSYDCRLRVHQVSTGRDFYSDNTFTLTISGITGLMILHGDAVNSDVGILQAPEFIPAANSLPDTLNALSHFYSSNNSGQKIAGLGQQILQSTSTYLYSEAQKQRSRIYVKTDKGVSWLNKDDLSYYGDWDAMFYIQGADKVNKGIPNGYVVMPGSAWIAFDDDQIYYMQPSGGYPYLFPEYTPDMKFGDGNSYTFAPALIQADKTKIQCLMYATTVNGKDRKGFVGISTMMTEKFYYFSALMDTKADNVIYNPGDMKADLVMMRANGNGHCMAVLKGDQTHPDYAGKYFMVDLAPNAAAPAGSATPYAGAPQQIYPMYRLADMDQAFAFEFGTTKNMCYYATPSKVYNYHVDGNVLYDAEPLGMADGSPLSLTGRVTMMKMLNSPNITTRFTDPILLVATYDGSRSALYALHMDTMTGRVLKAVKYDASNVIGWDFGEIRDVNIKGL